MKMSFICEDCKKEYSRETYTARDSKQTKKFWREKAGTEYGLCYDCYQEQKQQERAKASMEAAMKAKEMNLPELQGSEKQVAWAEKIRIEMLSFFERYAQERYVQKRQETIDLFLASVRKENRAKWWIDNRFDFLPVSDFVVFMEKYLTEVSPKLQSEKEKEDPNAVDAKTEATVYPENAISAVAAEIRIQNNRIVAIFEKNEAFREVVKALNFSWNGSVWERELNELTGAAHDRAAELGNKLLNAGIPVMIMDEAIRDAAIQGKYEPECNRWVLVAKEKGKLRIKWWEKNDRLYQVARKLPGSKWDKGVVISVSHYKEIEEFANLYSFKFTQKAQEAIETEKERIAKFERVKPAHVEEQEQKDGLKEILNSGSDIIDDLKD